jgi:nitrite reductase/ring-hydroxylating ferredoxin subunit
MDDGRRICSLTEIPDDSTFLFTVQDVDTETEREAILVRHDGDIMGWLNYCQHFTHINLDKGSGAELRNGEIVCTNHGAYFQTDTGTCTFGPCKGAVLNEIDVGVVGEDVFVTDEDYDYLRVGPTEDDGDDLVSESNYEF